jgi:hypothetical protein
MQRIKMRDVGLACLLGVGSLFVLAPIWAFTNGAISRVAGHFLVPGAAAGAYVAAHIFPSHLKRVVAPLAVGVGEVFYLIIVWFIVISAYRIVTGKKSSN